MEEHGCFGEGLCFVDAGWEEPEGLLFLDGGWEHCLEPSAAWEVLSIEDHVASLSVFEPGGDEANGLGSLDGAGSIAQAPSQEEGLFDVCAMVGLNADPPLSEAALAFATVNLGWVLDKDEAIRAQCVLCGLLWVAWGGVELDLKLSPVDWLPVFAVELDPAGAVRAKVRAFRATWRT